MANKTDIVEVVSRTVDLEQRGANWVCKVEGCSREEAARGLVGRHRA